MRKSLLLAWTVMLFAAPFLAFGQNRQITGTVTDDKGIPLPAVSVLEKGTSNGTVTNSQGSFSISARSANSVLVFSYAGMQSQELRIGTESNYNLSLQPGGQMSEVVVTALGISREKKALGYATQEIKAEEINRNRQPNVLNALQGKVAGVTISSTGGGPGQGATIRVRGINSIDVNQSNDPLFVIDGIILDNSTSTL
ncbi:MAG TPA: carboxypeptidase-like regulatory domain-containing protein, partial [Flavisolibacter sp.]